MGQRKLHLSQIFDKIFPDSPKGEKWVKQLNFETIKLTMHSPSLTLLAQLSSFQPNNGARDTTIDMIQTKEINIQIEAELRVWM